MDVRELQQRYKGDKCDRCGETVEDCVARYGTARGMFEFNHINPKRKHRNYKNLIRCMPSPEQLEELDKCTLFCSKCHAILHAQNTYAGFKLTSRVGDQSATQTFTGQVSYDRMANKLAFFTDNELLIYPYWLTLGDAPTRVVFGKELKETLWNTIVPLTKNRGQLSITDDNDVPLFGARRVDETCVEITQHCSFCIYPIQITFRPNFTIWIRNGLIVVRNGKTLGIHNNGTFRGILPYDQLKAVAESSA